MNFVFIEECEVRSVSCEEETWGMVDGGLSVALRPSSSQEMVALGLEALVKEVENFVMSPGVSPLNKSCGAAI